MPLDGIGIYRHYKGGLYEVLGVALEEATLTPVVVYRPIDELPAFMKEFGATKWTRPLDDFNAEVNAHGRPVSRFTKLLLSEIMQTRNERLLEWYRNQI